MKLYAVKTIQSMGLSVAVGIIGVLLVLGSQTVRVGVQAGMTLCGQTLIPSLFVFLCFGEWVAQSNLPYHITKILGWFFRFCMGPLWRGGTALFLCLLGGYPMGASALVRLYEQGILTKKQIRNAALFLFMPSPAFVIVAVGLGLLGSPSAGILLWGVCTCTTLLMTLVGCRLLNQEETPEAVYPQMPSTATLVEGVARASRQMIELCGWVILFAAMSEGIRQFPLPKLVNDLVVAGLEITNGCVGLTEYGLPILAGALSFGGVCTHLQIKNILRDCMPPMTHFLAVRCIQTALSFGFTYVVCRVFPVVQTTMVTAVGAAVSGGTVLPSVFLWITCVIFLSSIYTEKGRKQKDEKSRIHS